MFDTNGLGKSSVVEAVRWCLFGLADRPEAEVRNVFYPAGEDRCTNPHVRRGVRSQPEAHGQRHRDPRVAASLTIIFAIVYMSSASDALVTFNRLP